MFNKMLLWKEIRENKLVVILGILVPVAFSPTILRISPHGSEVLAVFNGLVIYPLFALFIGASLISTELATDTLPFLLSNPVKKWKLWLIKFFAGIFCLCFVILFSAFFTLLIIKLVYHQHYGDFLNFLTANDLKIAACQIAICYAIGLYCSVLLAEPMKATVVGILHVIVIDAFGYALGSALKPYRLADIINVILPLSSVCVGFFLFFSLVIFVRGGVLAGTGVMLRKIGKICGKAVGVIVLVGLLIYTCLNYLAGKDLERVRQEIKAAGASLELTGLIPPPVPDDENAAIIYQKAFALMQEGSKEEKKAVRAVFKASCINWSEENASLVRSLLEKNKEALDLVWEASLCKECRFPLAYEDGPSILLPHLAKMRQCARLLATKALFQKDEGKVDEALSTCHAGLRMGKSLHPEPILISQLVRIAINSIMLHALEFILSQNEVAPAASSALLKELDELEGHEAFARCFEGERTILGLWVFDRLRKYPSSWRNIIGGWFTGKMRIWMRLYSSHLGRPLFKKDQAFYLRMMEKQIALSALPYYQSVAEVRDFDKQMRDIPHYYILSGTLLPALEHAIVFQARSEAQIRACKLALALKIHKVEHGRHPESLEELKPRILSELPKDPFTGKDYIYRQEGAGFIVYSVGENLIDEDGVFDIIYTKRKPREKDDIVWCCEK